MTISVIVPCLKRDEMAERCLAEIRRQAAVGGATLDLVVVEGVAPYGRAVNDGLSRASGDYIAWVDADDEVLPDWWPSICGAVEGRPDVVVIGWHDDQSGMDLSYVPPDGVAPGNLLRAVLRDDPPCSFLWNKVVRKGLWDGERFDERWKFQADFALMPRILAKVRSVVSVDRVLYRYRFNPESISRRETAGHVQEVFDVRWCRFEDWRDTEYMSEAIVPQVNHVAERYICTVLKGSSAADDAILSAQREKLRGCCLTILRARTGWRERMRTLLTILNWTWPQRLSLLWHGKRLSRGG